MSVIRKPAIAFNMYYVLQTRSYLSTFFFYLFVLLLTPLYAAAQKNTYPVNDWIQKLNAKDPASYAYYHKVVSILKQADSTTAFNVIRAIEKEVASTKPYLDMKIKLITAFEMFHFKKGSEDEIYKLFKQALYKAYELNDAYMQYDISCSYAEVAYNYQKIPLAVLYSLMALEIDEKYHIDNNPRYIRFVMGEILYHAREYEKSIYCSKQGIPVNTAEPEMKKGAMMAWNTIGMAWQKLGNYDSAINAYARSLQFANATGNNIWIGIASGNMGQVYYLQNDYTRAKPLLALDYQTSKHYNVPDNAANSLQWVAKINLLQGKKDSALMQVKEAMQLLRQKPQPNYLQHIYHTTANIYQALNKPDSFYYYSNLYTTLHDSLEKIAALSSIEVATMQLNNEKDFHIIRSLQEQRKTEQLKRNITIGAIVLFSTIIILILNIQKQKLRHKQQLVLQQKAAVEAEKNAALTQLDMFMQNILEKTSMIDKLEQQLNNKTQEQQQLIAELSQQTILTPQDWKKFRTLFEKVYPGFFLKLSEIASDITLAELRMAALMRLHLTTTQMASMLGISANSVNKARQRLRHRLNTSSEKGADELIAKL
ncbi:MAG TPA: tetratricopeptide repeat protein [Parafilimonas sp.]|nr:tetratricopeptide repeat protein [Parafilimonas sp.]